MPKPKLTLGEINGVIEAASVFGSIFGYPSAGTDMPRPQDIIDGVKKLTENRASCMSLARAMASLNRASKKLKQIEVSVG